MVNDPNIIILVAEVNDLIVGYLAFEYKKKATKYVWVDEIIVDDRYKNNGYGTKLFMEVTKYALKNNCKRIELNCWSFNKEAVKFYENLGFIQQRIIFEKEI